MHNRVIWFAYKMNNECNNKLILNINHLKLNKLVEYNLNKQNIKKKLN